MKKLCFLIIGILLLLTFISCAAEVTSGSQPMYFYYATDLLSTQSSASDVAFFEIRYTSNQGSADLSPADENPTVESVVTEYLLGPVTEGLVSPFPEGTEYVNHKFSNGELTLILSKQYAELAGVYRTIADYCITMTMTSFSDIDAVSIEIDGSVSSTSRLSADSFVLSDNFESYSEESITIYFADQDNRYLLSETRRMVAGENESIEQYVIEQLIGGPVGSDKQSVMPAGTRLLSIALGDGICTVTFDEAFIENGPKTEAQERMTVFAIVNSLTEIEAIESVKIRAGDRDIAIYRYIQLSDPLERNEDIISSESASSGMIDRALYLKNWSPDFLSTVPMHVPKISGRTEEYSVLSALIGYESQGIYQNPIPAGTEIISMETEDGLCTVNLSSEFIDNSERSASAQRLAIMSIVLCLTDFKHIDSVQIIIEGVQRDHLDFPMSEPIERTDELFFP